MTDPQNHPTGERVAAFLKANEEKPWAKRIARKTGYNVHTVETWLQGKTPTSKQLTTLVGLYKEPFLRAIYPEAFERGDERAERALQIVTDKSPAIRWGNPVGDVRFVPWLLALAIGVLSKYFEPKYPTAEELEKIIEDLERTEDNIAIG
jgi:hypothetical protein